MTDAALLIYVSVAAGVFAEVLRIAEISPKKLLRPKAWLLVALAAICGLAWPIAAGEDLARRWMK